MSENKTYRLNKVLRELNISLDRAIEYMSSKGYDIEARPTTKISQEIYSILKKEFQFDKVKTEWRDQIKAESDNKNEKNTEKQKTSIIFKHKLSGPKMVGRIDLDKMNAKKDWNDDVRNLDEENSYDFSIHNFRKAKDKWKFELAPITLLTGTNNSGKSSVLKSILVLDDYVNSENHFEINFNGLNYKKHKIDSFSNALNWAALENNNPYLEFSFRRFGFFIQLKFGPQNIKGDKILKGHLEKLRIRRLSDDSEFFIKRISEGHYEFYLENDILSINDEDSSYYSLLQNMGMKTLFEKNIAEIEQKRKDLDPSDPKSITLKQELNQNTSRLRRVHAQIKKLESERKNKLKFNSQFSLKEFDQDELQLDNIIQILLLRYIDDNQKKVGGYNNKSELDKILHFGKRLINSLKFDAFHLSPQRNSQTRLYLNENTSNDIYELINWHSQHPLIDGYNPYVFIQDWMEKFKIGEDFRIKDIEGLASVIEIKENGEWRNIVDKGFGVGQLFSIIFRIGLCINDFNLNYGDNSNTIENPKPLILIEEPETNLHPKLQSLLADLFYESNLEFGIQFLIETHSEYIIRNSQLIINDFTGASKRKVSETEYIELPFVVYYFDEKKGPYNMEYRNDGIFKKEFGLGFFDEASKKSLQLLKASRK